MHAAPPTTTVYTAAPATWRQVPTAEESLHFIHRTSGDLKRLQIAGKHIRPIQIGEEPTAIQHRDGRHPCSNLYPLAHLKLGRGGAVERGVFCLALQPRNVSIALAVREIRFFPHPWHTCAQCRPAKMQVCNWHNLLRSSQSTNLIQKFHN